MLCSAIGSRFCKSYHPLLFICWVFMWFTREWALANVIYVWYNNKVGMLLIVALFIYSQNWKAATEMLFPMEVYAHLHPHFACWFYGMVRLRLVLMRGWNALIHMHMIVLFALRILSFECGWTLVVSFHSFHSFLLCFIGSFFNCFLFVTICGSFSKLYTQNEFMHNYLQQSVPKLYHCWLHFNTNYFQLKYFKITIRW